MKAQEIHNMTNEELAKKLGADEGFNSTDPDFAEKIKAYTGGQGFGAVYETAGSPVTMKMAFELAANKAHVCFIGTPTPTSPSHPRCGKTSTARNSALSAPG